MAFEPVTPDYGPKYGRKDILDAQGRFVGREGGITREDIIGAQLANFNKLQGLMENGLGDMSGLQALAAQAMGQVNAGARTMGTPTGYTPEVPVMTAGDQAEALKKQQGVLGITEDANY